MTENEAIKEFNKMIGDRMKTKRGISEKQHELFQIAVDSLEEIQQYRTIGTVERFQQLSEQFKPHTTDKTSCPERHCNKCDKYRKEAERYQAIGTVEECQEAREKQRGKKPILSTPCKSINYYLCPNCKKILSIGKAFCHECGNRIDWSEEDA